MNYIFYIIFGLFPSIIWLLFYLRQDVHPESNFQVIKIFILGMLAAIPAALIEWGLFVGIEAVDKLFNLHLILLIFLYIFLAVALVEEFVKYLVFKLMVERTSAMDEPIDIILYMIIAGLGFAALENLLILWPPQAYEVMESLILSCLRFAGATFLHALCSGMLGYFIALSFFNRKRRKRFFLTGLAIVAILHGLHNLSIMRIEGGRKFIIPAIILAGLAFFLFLGINKIKRMKAVCKMNYPAPGNGVSLRASSFGGFHSPPPK